MTRRRCLAAGRRAELGVTPVSLPPSRPPGSCSDREAHREAGSSGTGGFFHGDMWEYPVSTSEGDGT